MSLRHAPLLDLAAGRLDAKARGAAIAHLDGCASCAHAYHALMEAERALGGDLDQPSAAELDAMLPQLLPGAAPAPQRGVGWWWLAPVAAACAGVLFYIAPRSPEFAARGGLEPAAVGLRAFCARAGQAHAVEEKPCGHGDSLVVAVHAPAGVTTRLHLWLVDAHGDEHPFPLSAGGMAITGSGHEQVLEPNLELGVAVASGAAQLVAVLCAGCAIDTAHDLATNRHELPAGARVTRIPVAVAP